MAWWEQLGRLPHRTQEFRTKSLHRKSSARSHGVAQYISDSYVLNDPYLSFFIRNFTTSTEVAELPPADFVSELYRQWKGKFPNEHQSPREPLLSSLEKEVADPFVFISYASEDAAAAFRIHDELEARRIPVWMDKERLLVGDRYEKIIRRRIFKCGLFVPLISKTTDRRTEGFSKRMGMGGRSDVGFPWIRSSLFDSGDHRSNELPGSKNPRDFRNDALYQTRRWRTQFHLCPGASAKVRKASAADT